ncbi:FliH/SctL family protein [Telmatospirillum sp.]|uniref:FliH/SctL family protein n=1 Tax=Telmatospirillum sp. TaxID=2079197 RepID=UPI00284C9E34|nr:FliH/SctL family protein [Telmatospirillum sp.]MDR3440780.1 FliH/SctL family protein [Telmatospirillum sp.]
MATLQKFLFDLDFDAPPRPAPDVDYEEDLEEVLEEPEEPPPPPMFSEEELTLTRQQAFEAGRQAGMEETEAATERLTALALTAISDQLNGMADIQAEANDGRLRDAISVAVAVVRKLQPEMSRDNALEEIAGVVKECLAHIEKDVRVTIRVNPEHMDSIRHFANQAAEATGFDGKLLYAGDPRIVPGDCRVEWGDGGAERDEARLWAEIDATLARALGSEPANVPDEEPAENVLGEEVADG